MQLRVTHAKATQERKVIYWLLKGNLDAERISHGQPVQKMVANHRLLRLSPSIIGKYAFLATSNFTLCIFSSSIEKMCLAEKSPESVSPLVRLHRSYRA